MSALIDLGFIDQKENQVNNTCSKELAAISKIKRFLTVFFQSSFKNRGIEVKKHGNSFWGYVQMPPFHNCYSLLTKITYNGIEGSLKQESLLLSEGRPFIIATKNLRLAGIQLLYQNRHQFSDLLISLDPNSGQIRIKSCVMLSEELISNSEIFHCVINKILRAIIQNSQKFIKLFQQMSNEFQVSKKPSIHQPLFQGNNKIIDSIRKYLKISFLQIQFSDSQITRGRPLERNDSNQRSAFYKHQSIDLNQFSIKQSLSLFQTFETIEDNFQSIILTEQQMRELVPLLKFPKAKIMNFSQNEFIFNQVNLANPQKICLSNTGLRGGTSQLWCAKIQFQYTISQTQKVGLEKIVVKNDRFPLLQKPVLIKIPLNKASQKYVEHEIKILASMKLASSAYMLKYYRSQQNSPIKNKLIMDWLPNCLDLHNYMQKNKQTMSIITKFIILGNISNGLRFLRNHKIVHMDLTPKNVLVGPGFFTKIIDFGQAYCDRISVNNYSPGFTNPYGPPQSLTQNQFFTSKQDTFSLGMIMFKLLIGNFPFNPTQQLKNSYKSKTYNKKLYFAIESLQYTWLPEPMLLIFSLFVRCKSVEEVYRPYATWFRIIMKLLMNWYIYGTNSTNFKSIPFIK